MKEWLSLKLNRLNNEKKQVELEIEATLKKCRELRKKEEQIKKEISGCWAISAKIGD